MVKLIEWTRIEVYKKRIVAGYINFNHNELGKVSTHVSANATTDLKGL
ncbi:MAG: hypothetical protein RIC12_01485 [Pirellulales bacterium]